MRLPGERERPKSLQLQQLTSFRHWACNLDGWISSRIRTERLGTNKYRDCSALAAQHEFQGRSIRSGAASTVAAGRSEQGVWALETIEQVAALGLQLFIH